MSHLDGSEQTGEEDWVYVLRKAFYGLRQSSGKWYLVLHKLLIAFAFAQSKTDPTLYVWTRGGAFAIIVVYPNNISLSSNCEKSPDLVVNCFKRSFKVQVDSEIEKFLECSVKDSGNTDKLHNAPMIERLSKDVGTKNFKPASTSSPQRINLADGDSQALSSATP